MTVGFVTGLQFKIFQIRALYRAWELAQSLYPNKTLALKALWGMMKKNRRNNQYRNLTKATEAGNRTFFMMSVSGFPGPGLDTMLRNELHRSTPVPGFTGGLNLLFLSVTKKCGMHCRHCLAGDTLNGKDNLSVSDLALIIQKFQARGLSNIELGGGEPLNRYRDLLQLLQISDTRMSDFWVTTNGFALTEEKAYALKAAGLTGISISLDHWDAGLHDEFRGLAGAFDHACRAARYARAAGLVTALTLVPTRDFCTEDHLMRYFELAHDLKVHFVRILEPRAAGAWSGQHDVELLASHYQVLESFHKKVQHATRYKHYPILEYHGTHQRNMGCGGAGERYLMVDAEGDVHPCPFCRQSCGNAVEEPLDIVLRRMHRGAACQAYPRITEALNFYNEPVTVDEISF